jgi:hypothetical protein
MSEHSPLDVAQWMVNEIKERGILHQSDAIAHVRSFFGEDFVFVNENGNPSLSKEVKKEFRKLHRGKVAWDRDGFFWGWT